MGTDIRVIIDGKEVSFEPEKTILQLATELGIDIPHFCYHPGLTEAGKCRMCMVEIEGFPMLKPSCATKLKDAIPRGRNEIIIHTNSDRVKEYRKGLLELYLANHPVACPECDKAGECTLQNYTYEYGPTKLYFKLPKDYTAPKQIAEHVLYFKRFCILCTRCINFLENVAGIKDLTVVERGHKSYIDIFDNVYLDTPLSLNIVDLCPVGALRDKNFTYAPRVWLLDKRTTICPHCARGCNISVQSLNNEIKRIKPVYNPDINGYFMCDYGRIPQAYKHVYENRLIETRIGNKLVMLNDIYEHVANLLKNSEKTIIVATLWNTNEELELVAELSKELNADVVLLEKPVEADLKFPGFYISGDKNPNRKGANKILPNHLSLDEVNKSYDVAIVINQIPDYEFKLSFEAEHLVWMDIQNRYPDNVEVLVPIPTTYEKGGSFTNIDGITQSFKPALNPVGALVSLEEILSNIISNIKAISKAG